MPTQIYKNCNGKRVPSVTGIISRFKESGGLLFWAWQLGVDGKDYRQERDKAASSGTVAHEMVEAHLKGEEWSGSAPKDILEKAKSAFQAYLSWASMAGVEVLHSEVPLVSEQHQYGGCMDAIGICRGMNNGIALLDWKTSNALYADYLYQLAAYGMLWDENYPDNKLTGGYHLIRFAKENGDFSHLYFPSLEEEAETFVTMRALYDRVKKTEKRVK